MSDVKSADQYVTGLVRRRPVMSIPHFLLSSYMYYVDDDPILSDWVYDEVLVKALKALLLEHPIPKLHLLHPHGKLIPWDGLDAGSGFMVKYPDQVKYAAEAMRRVFK